MIPQPDLPVIPDDFVGRKQQIDAYRQALQQGLITGRTSSFAFLGDWGIGKSSLLPKYAALCSGPHLRFAETKEAWDHFVRPAHLNGAIFFVDDLKNITAIRKADLALTIRNQFQSFGIEGMNYSICFSATADYFAETKGPADPVPRFYTKLYLEPLNVEETIEYVRSVFGTSPNTTAIIAARLHRRTLGYPYFVAFVRRHLGATESEIQPDQLETIWPAIFDQLEREKFRSDISQLSVKELDLIHRFANLSAGEFRARQFGVWSRSGC